MNTKKNSNTVVKSRLGILLAEQQKKRNLSIQQLSNGLVSPSTYWKMTNETIAWPKVIGDVLFQRLGITPELFMGVEVKDEFLRWKLREEICTFIPSCPNTAIEKITQYQNLYPKRTSIEEQFLKKVLLICELTYAQSPDEYQALIPAALDAISCTIRADWQHTLLTLPLAPCELEAILLLTVIYALAEDYEKAVSLHLLVWEYPNIQHWDQRLYELLIPQAALAGMIIHTKVSNYYQAYLFGKEALELLRHTHQQRYVLLLMEQLLQLPAENPSIAPYQKEISPYQTYFLKLYQECNIPAKRIWQTIHFENVQEVGTILKELRLQTGLSQKKVVSDNTSPVLGLRQLQRIEHGQHCPSFYNFRQLIHFYGKPFDWMAPSIDTDSLEVVRLWDQIICAFMTGNSKHVPELIQRFQLHVNPRSQKGQQKLIYWQAFLDHQENIISTAEYIEQCKKALACTSPQFHFLTSNYHLLDYDEITLIRQIANSYIQIGEHVLAEEILIRLYHAFQNHIKHTGTPYWGYFAVVRKLAGLWGDTERISQSLQLLSETLLILLNRSSLANLDQILYDIAWTEYEQALRTPQNLPELHERWQNHYLQSQTFAAFYRNTELLDFLTERTAKYMNSIIHPNSDKYDNLPEEK